MREAAREPARAARARPATRRPPAEAVLEVVDADEPPLRVFLGTYPYPVVEAAYRGRLDTWNAWPPLAARA